MISTSKHLFGSCNWFSPLTLNRASENNENVGPNSNRSSTAPSVLESIGTSSSYEESIATSAEAMDKVRGGKRVVEDTSYDGDGETATTKKRRMVTVSQGRGTGRGRKSRKNAAKTFATKTAKERTTDENEFHLRLSVRNSTLHLPSVMNLTAYRLPRNNYALKSASS